MFYTHCHAKAHSNSIKAWNTKNAFAEHFETTFVDADKKYPQDGRFAQKFTSASEGPILGLVFCLGF